MEELILDNQRVTWEFSTLHYIMYITFDNNEEVNMTMNCLQMQQPNFCCYGIFKLMPRCEDVISILGICVKNYDT